MDLIIALCGVKNVGKTTTLNKLIDLLSLIADSYGIERLRETRASFTIRGRKVAVCTPGDTKDIIKDNISYFPDIDEYDVFVTASHTRGGTVEELESLAKKKDAKLIWIDKEDDKSKNPVIAAGLLGLIMQGINKDFRNILLKCEEAE